MASAAVQSDIPSEIHKGAEGGPVEAQRIKNIHMIKGMRIQHASPKEFQVWLCTLACILFLQLTFFLIFFTSIFVKKNHLKHFTTYITELVSLPITALKLCGMQLASCLLQSVYFKLENHLANFALTYLNPTCVDVEV